MNVVLQGADAWTAGGLSARGIVSVHQGHTMEVAFAGEAEAQVVSACTDRLFMPPGGPWAELTGHGHYHETYLALDGAWRIARLRITRLRVQTR